MRWIIGIVGILGAVMVSQSGQEMLGIDQETAYAIGGIFVLVALLFGPAFGRGALEGEQDQLDLRAQKLSNDLRNKILAGKKVNRKFAVFLRPFFSQGSMEVDNPYKGGFLGVLSPSHYTESRKTNLERILTRGVAPYFPLVAIGGDFGQIGPGRISTPDETWQDEFDRLVVDGTFLIILPSDQPATRWELQQLVQRKLIHKTYFLMPPEGTFERTIDEAGVETKIIQNMSEAWAAAQQTLVGDGIALPDFDRDGGIFRYDEDGKVFERFSGFGKTKIAQAISAPWINPIRASGVLLLLIVIALGFGMLGNGRHVFMSELVVPIAFWGFILGFTSRVMFRVGTGVSLAAAWGIPSLLIALMAPPGELEIPALSYYFENLPAHLALLDKVFSLEFAVVAALGFFYGLVASRVMARKNIHVAIALTYAIAMGALAVLTGLGFGPVAIIMFLCMTWYFFARRRRPRPGY